MMAFYVFCALLIPIVGILSIIGSWIIFSKAGKEGWEALVPVHSLVTFIEIAGRPGWWIFLFAVPILNIVLYIMTLHGLSKKFGHGTGFTVGLLFLPFVFKLILAFGSSKYNDANNGAPTKPLEPTAPKPSSTSERLRLRRNEAGSAPAPAPTPNDIPRSTPTPAPRQTPASALRPTSAPQQANVSAPAHTRVPQSAPQQTAAPAPAHTRVPQSAPRQTAAPAPRPAPAPTPASRPGLSPRARKPMETMDMPANAKYEETLLEQRMSMRQREAAYSEANTPKSGLSKIVLILTIVIGVLLLIGIGIGIYTFTNRSKSSDVTQYTTDRVEKNDSVYFEEETESLSSPETVPFPESDTPPQRVPLPEPDASKRVSLSEPEVPSEPVSTPEPAPSSTQAQTSLTFPFGKYSGDIENGKASGMGKMVYTKRTLISKLDKRKRYAEAGQYVIGTWYKNELEFGKLYDKNGNILESIIIGRAE